jgi:exopolysaccharide biosynthesis predicted pyruvyltransferase EpsI
MNIIVQIEIAGKLINYVEFPSSINTGDSDWLYQSKLYLKEAEIELGTIVGFYNKDMNFSKVTVLIDNRNENKG